MAISRRDTLKLAGSAATLSVLSSSFAQAGTAAAPAFAGAFNRFKVGEHTVTLLSDGQTAPGPLFPNWGANPDRLEVFTKTLEGSFINPALAVNNFTPMVIQTDKHTVLVDTGRGATGKLMVSMAAAGIDPKSIDTVFITHGHGDHMGGVTSAGIENFPGAELVIGETEFKFWSMQASPSDSLKNNILNLKSRYRQINDGDEVVPGVKAVLTPGHTVGHMATLVTSGSSSFMHFADAAGHWLLSLKHPEHYLNFDADKTLVVQTRAKLFDMAATEKMLIAGYHFPWPAAGRIRRIENGFEFVPAPFIF